MDLVQIQYPSVIRQYRREFTRLTVSELVLFFDNVVSYMKNLVYTNERNDTLDILTLISDDFASFYTLQLFDHPAIINHSIFIYIGRTLEMLLTKANHSHSIPMKKYEEGCLYSISYFVAQLCLYRNEAIKSFYGLFSDLIPSVTDKINEREETINETSGRSNTIAEKPNLKVIGLPPSASKTRPIEENEYDITKIPHRKAFSQQLIPPPTIELAEPEVLPIVRTNFPPKTYQEVFFTKSLLTKLIRAIDDLSQNEYSPYHVKYKVVDRLVRVCSTLNLVDKLLDPIVKCLRSKFYRQVFTILEPEQLRFSPRQLFFIYRCTQFIIQHEFQQQEQILHSLCQSMIDATKSIVENIITSSGN
ncbi:unnamed protein product [Rotaria sp. Silwood1]|nr:unnamed protein product [Rotaria sp. Silwood1]